MLRHSWLVGVLGLVTVACSGSDPTGSGSGSELNGEANAVGEVAFPLTAFTNGIQYELASAKFTIVGLPLGKLPRIATPPPEEPVHSEVLPVGAYTVQLQDGWQLLAKGPADKDFAPVDASLVSPNPAPFAVKRAAFSDVVFRFATAAGVIIPQRGVANLRIDVSDCSSYDQFTAALGTLTVDCRGTIGPSSYIVDQDGLLRRNFDACLPGRNPNMLDSINDLLGLQFPIKDHPNLVPIAKQCILGRWNAWRDALDPSIVCPNWTRTAINGVPNRDLIARDMAGLPKLPAPDTRNHPPIVAVMKTTSLYAIGFDAPVQQACGSPAACAVSCAGGFPGFVVSNDQMASVGTDPTYWLLDTNFDPMTTGDSPLDPFSSGYGYYHPMSYSGPLPGALVGHRNRAIEAEQCSYYDSGSATHMLVDLKLNCTNVSNYTSCISLCLP